MRPAQVDAVDVEGCTSLVVAVLGRHSECVKLLVEAGADADVIVPPVVVARVLGEGVVGDVHLLMCAVEDTGICDTLLKAGADVYNTVEGRPWSTALGLMVTRRNFDAAKRLLGSATGFGDVVINEDPAVLVETIRSDSPASRPFLSYLFQFETDPNQAVQGTTPLQVACEKGSLVAAKFLLQAGVEQFSTDDNGLTPHLHCIPHAFDILLLLVEDNPRQAGALKDAQGRSILAATLIAIVRHAEVPSWDVVKKIMGRCRTARRALDDAYTHEGRRINVIEEMASVSPEMTPSLEGVLRLLAADPDTRPLLKLHLCAWPTGGDVVTFLSAECGLVGVGDSIPARGTSSPPPPAAAAEEPPQEAAPLSLDDPHALFEAQIDDIANFMCAELEKMDFGDLEVE